MVIADTVKPVIKGHCNKGTLSQNGVQSFQCQGTCDEGTPVMLGHFLSDIEVSLEDRFYCRTKLMYEQQQRVCTILLIYSSRKRSLITTVLSIIKPVNYLP